ncbi:MAG: hypothetical protein KIS66_09410 [Fimbriimonadaceae bacterium]|nr:hypothetical protein [Fimbriimonadaceae bacterium]
MHAHFLLFPVLCVALAGLSLAESGDTKDYRFVLLVAGKNRKELPTEEATKLQEGHMGNLNRLFGMGKLVGAGPMADAGRIRGIGIMVTDTLDEARKLMNEDPAVMAGQLDIEVLDWRGPANFLGKTFKEPMELTNTTLAFCNRGPKFDTLLPADSERLRKEHVAYLEGIRGEIVAEGSFLTDHHRQTMTILMKNDLGLAEKLISESPAVKGGLYSVEVYRWWYAKGLLPAKDGG